MEKLEIQLLIPEPIARRGGWATPLPAKSGIHLQQVEAELKSKLRWLGMILVAIGLLGFLTVADDLRHTGELIGVGSISLVGVLMVGISFMNRNKV